MQSNALNSTAIEPDLTVNDLGPLAWVLDEIRKSLNSATKALKRFVREAETAPGADLAALDAGQLRIARQQLHQAVGALEMVGLAGPAQVLRAMEAAVQKFVQQPDQCSQKAAAKIERASFALTDYLEGVLAGRPVSAVSLFPQYRDIQELVRADRIHPADLWPLEWRWLEPELAVTAEPRRYDDSARAVMDPLVLQLMRGKAPQAAQSLRELSLEFSASQTDRQPRIFWKIAGAYFEAVAHDLLGTDIYVRRAASRILLQYASLAKGDSSISERLAQDLLFFCAQAVSSQDRATPALSAVRSVYGLARFKPVNYEQEQFGRFDPALLAQARKRIISAKELWSSLSGGDVSRFKAVVDQFSLVTDSLLKLHPSSEPLAQALTQAIDVTARSEQPPGIELALEVATSILYLEAVFEDLDPSDPQLGVRTANLAARLDGVRAGGEPQPLEGWMQELYRRVNDKQTMGSVVGELRLSLGEIETSLDEFFRNPQDKTALQTVHGQLAQMRGVFSVLGLDQAAHGVSRMKGCIEQMLLDDIDEARDAGTFEQLGNNLGALSFLIDMLNYQPVLAKKLFVYDEEQGELKPLMGRTQNAASAALASTLSSDRLSQEVIDAVREAGGGESDDSLTEKLDALATHAALAEQSTLAQSVHDAALAISANNADATANALTTLAAAMVQAPVAPVSQAVPVDFEEDDLRGIFLEEAREVLGNALDAIAALASEPGDAAQLTVLRRAFHTLKGSARMVGLEEFGEAAWALEQLLNSWLADQKTATIEFRSLCADVLDAFERWIAAIAADQGATWSAFAFRSGADAMRTEGRYSALNLEPVGEHRTATPALEVVAADMWALTEPQAKAEVADHPGAGQAVDAAVEPEVDLLVGDELTVAAALADRPAEPVLAPVIESEGIDFDRLFASSVDSGILPELADPAVADPTQRSSEVQESVEETEWSADDFDKLFPPEAAAPEPVASAPLATSSATAPGPADALLEPMESVATTPPPLEAVAASVNAAAPDDDSGCAPTVDGNGDERIKVIGNLRIGIPLFNVYLNEADEWSRRLVTEVSEWAMEGQQLVSDSTVALAHSLAGSSATVGFLALSEMARALEHALQQSRAHHSHGASQYGPLFVAAAEDIRRLLHQFAAGFLKESDADILERLEQLDFSDSVLPSESSFAGLDFSAESLPAQALSQEPVPAVAVPRAQLILPDSETFDEEGGRDIDAHDAIDPELFPIFQEEGAELMPELGGALRQWSARPDNLSARTEVLRVLHTLKGSARLAGAMRLGEMAHRIESEIEYLGSDAAASQEFEPLLTRFDAMQATFDALCQSATASAVSLPADEAAALGAPDVLADEAASTREATASKRAIPTPSGMVLQSLRPVVSASVRVRSQLIDRMVNQAGEVMITRSRLEAELAQLRSSLGDMNGNLNRLRQQLRDLELQAETQMQSRLAQAKEDQAGFDPLEFDRFTRVQELTRMMAESVNDVATVQRSLQRTLEATEDDLVAQARQTRELQRDLLRTRMVEFESISERLYRVVRQASKETGKPVRLELLGATIEMDRGTLDRMTPAFEHLLRNCVVHGIESAQSRADSGKDPVGHMSVHLRQDGNDVSVEFSDDGAGLNLRRIREKALALGLVSADQPLDDQQAVNLIFTPGFSTAAQVTELAGRGIGMDVVRAEVNSLGGRIETSSVAGKGTQFKLVLPLTTAVTQVVIIRSGNLLVGVPATVVNTVRRVSGKALQHAYDTGLFDAGDEVLPFFWSGALLQVSHHSSDAQDKTMPVIIFRSADQRIAVHVDEVLGHREVVVKNLGPQLSRLPGLAGMSVLPSGSVVLIYNPVALASVYGQQARAWSAEPAEPQLLDASAASNAQDTTAEFAVPQRPLILVVDDSITVRRVTQRLLQREGYRVALAADGLQALERLQEERPAVVLSDIEMPRMDGFDLTRNIRADARLSHLPILMITSRIAEKHREHAGDLGVDHYLGKPYSEEELLSLVRHYCTTEMAAAV